MNDVLASAVVLLLGSLLVLLAGRNWTRMERGALALSFAAHVFATVAQIAITSISGGDMLTYMKEGTLIARAIEVDPGRFGNLWVDLLLQRELHEALPVLGAGHATGTMVALAAGLALVFRYSLYGACLSVAVAACLGKFALYRVFRDLLPTELRLRALIAILLVPSAVFWSSGIIKEAFVMAGIGPVWLGVHLVLRGRPVRGALLVAMGAVVIGLLKPYTLFALAVAAGAWVGVDRLHARTGRIGPVNIRPAYLLLAGGLIYGAVVALSQLYPTYAMDNLGEDLARHQRLGVVAGGGSYYQMGDETAMSLQKQIAFAPLAIGTALFRPFVFEANNALALVASLEILVITGLIVHGLIRTGPRRAMRSLLSSPVLVAALVFTLTFGMAIGLATTNFGSLSRYRMPLMPFYLVLVLVLFSPVVHRAKTPVAKRVKGPRTPKAESLAVRTAAHARANVRLRGASRS